MGRKTLALAAVVAGLAWCAWAQADIKPAETKPVAVQQGTARGIVVGAQRVKVDGVQLIKVVILTNTAAKQTFQVGPDNASAYQTAGQLKTHDSVTISWETRGKSDKRWITQIEVRKTKKGE